MANDAREQAERIVQRMDRATSALESLSKQGDRKEREQRVPRSPEERKALIQQDRASVAASKVPLNAEHAVAAFQAADAAKSLYKLAKHGSVTGGIADLAGHGLNAVGLKGAGHVASQVGTVAAIGETAAGNWASAPRAIAGAPELAKSAVTMPLAAARAARAAGSAVERGADYFFAPTRNAAPFGQSVAGMYNAESGDDGLRHYARALQKPHQIAETTGKYGGMGAGAIAGGLAMGPIGALLGGYLGGKAGRMGANVGFSAVTPGEWATKSASKLKDFADNLTQANLRFAEFSGGMQRVAVEQEIREMNLSRERGDRRAQSAGYAAEQAFKLKKTTASVEDFGAKLKGYAAGFGAKMLDNMINPWGLTQAGLNWAGKKVDAAAEQAGLRAKGMDQDFKEPLHMYGRPDRFKWRG